MTRGEWDQRIPETVNDVVSLLERRTDVHVAWREYFLSGSPAAKAAMDAGVGTVESHTTYINQYKAAIEILIREVSEQATTYEDDPAVPDYGGM